MCVFPVNLGPPFACSVDSDQYAFNAPCGERVISAGNRVQQAPNLTSPHCHVGGDGKQLPSGVWCAELALLWLKERLCKGVLIVSVFKGVTAHQA